MEQQSKTSQPGARLRPVKAPISLPASEVLMEDMALYAERIDLQGMMQEYLKRVLLERPDDPIDFLLGEAAKHPFRKVEAEPLPDLRTEDVKAKYMDERTHEEKKALLQEIFSAVEPLPGGGGKVSAAQMIVTLNNDPGLLLERFPLHVNELHRAIEKIASSSSDGSPVITMPELARHCLKALSVPGGR